MVSVQPNQGSARSSSGKPLTERLLARDALVGLSAMFFLYSFVAMLFGGGYHYMDGGGSNGIAERRTQSADDADRKLTRHGHPQIAYLVDPLAAGGGGGGEEEEGGNDKHHVRQYQCPYKSIDDLAPEERYPNRRQRQRRRHIVDPPEDTRITLVCCETTAGPWSVAVHHSWAPRGSARFLEMVNSGYFHHKIPLMRCVEDFLCQFGLSGEYSGEFARKIRDDPPWLPTGQSDESRVDARTGTKRFRKGYFAYSGSGPNTRGRQLIVSLADQRSLGDGDEAPWEVPWGELVGRHSYETLDRVYTGYGDNGPPQEVMVEPGALDVAENDYPELDWILGCSVVDEVDEDEEASGEPEDAEVDED